MVGGVSEEPTVIALAPLPVNTSAFSDFLLKDFGGPIGPLTAFPFPLYVKAFFLYPVK